jgi:hypothetical protein
MGAFSGPEISDSSLIVAFDGRNARGYTNNPENLARYSEEFQNSLWNSSSFGSNASVTANAINSPIGDLTADLLTFSPDGTGQSRRQQSFSFSAGTYTNSVFVKKGTLSVINLFVTFGQTPFPNISYNFDTDTITPNSGIVTSSRILYPDGWVRITATATVTSHSGGIGLLSTIAGTVYAWGFQCERGGSPTDYNKTIASQLTHNTIWTSVIPTTNNGTLVQRPVFTSLGSGSFYFDGRTNYGPYILLQSNIFNSSLPNFTISSWVYPISHGIIIGNHFHNSTWESVWFSTNDFVVNSANNTTNRTVLSYGQFINFNEWNNVVAVNSRSQSFMKVYINGREVVSNNASILPWTSSVSPSIGAQRVQNVTGGTSVHLNGYVGQVLVYNYSLTADEIRANYNAFKSRYLQ